MGKLLSRSQDETGSAAGPGGQQLLDADPVVEVVANMVVNRGYDLAAIIRRVDRHPEGAFAIGEVGGTHDRIGDLVDGMPPGEDIAQFLRHIDTEAARGQTIPPLGKMT